MVVRVQSRDKRDKSSKHEQNLSQRGKNTDLTGAARQRRHTHRSEPPEHDGGLQLAMFISRVKCEAFSSLCDVWMVQCEV